MSSVLTLATTARFGAEADLLAEVQWWFDDPWTLATASWVVKGIPIAIAGVSFCRSDRPFSPYDGMRVTSRRMVERLWSRLAKRTLHQAARDYADECEQYGVSPALIETPRYNVECWDAIDGLYQMAEPKAETSAAGPNYRWVRSIIRMSPALAVCFISGVEGTENVMTVGISTARCCSSRSSNSTATTNSGATCRPCCATKST